MVTTGGFSGCRPGRHQPYPRTGLRHEAPLDPRRPGQPGGRLVVRRGSRRRRRRIVERRREARREQHLQRPVHREGAGAAVVVPSNGTSLPPGKAVVTNPYNVPLFKDAGSLGAR